jgi:uncharacterized protein (TIGR03435 family)
MIKDGVHRIGITRNTVALRLTGLALAVAVASAPAQTNTSTVPQFAVASIKPNNANCCEEFGVGNGKGGGKYVTLKALIGLAYQVQQFQISGGPSWIASDRFDVEGKSEDPKADFAQLRLMLQSLLSDRFKLRIHRTTKQSPVYALVVAKGGPKINLSADQTSPDVNGPVPPGAGPNHGALRMGPGLLIGNAVPMSRFAMVLSRSALDRLAIDKTNLVGRFDIELRWAPEWRGSPNDPEGSPVVASDYPSLFTAIQEQLGLKLESARGPVGLIVIDHVERPSEN